MFAIARLGRQREGSPILSLTFQVGGTILTEEAFNARYEVRDLGYLVPWNIAEEENRPGGKVVTTKNVGEAVGLVLIEQKTESKGPITFGKGAERTTPLRP